MITVCVRKHLSDYRFVCKDPEELQNSIKILGLQVLWGVWDLQWNWGGEVLDVPHGNVFPLCEETCESLTLLWLGQGGHWIHQVPGKCNSWDTIPTNSLSEMMVQETVARIKLSNPVKGECCITSQDMDLWVDASFLSYMGVNGG